MSPPTNNCFSWTNGLTKSRAVSRPAFTAAYADQNNCVQTSDIIP